MTNVFISYRRDDTQGDTARIRKELADHFGAQHVFMDTGGIPYGTNFEEHIQKKLEGCEVLVAVIGSNWLKVESDGRVRIQDNDDWVRREIRFALERGTRIIPVLIKRTECPRVEQLPSDLSRLGRLQALSLDTGIDFDHHIKRLIEAIGGEDPPPPGPKLTLSLLQPVGGEVNLPKPICSDQKLFVQNEFLKRINAETERMGLPSLDWVNNIIERYKARNSTVEPSSEERYARALNAWYGSLMREALGKHDKQLIAVRTVLLQLMLENQGTVEANEIKVELKIEPRESVELGRPEFELIHAFDPAPRPPNDIGISAPIDLERPEIDWYDRPKYFDEPYMSDRIGLDRKDQAGKMILVGSTRQLSHEHEIRLAPIYMVYGGLPASDVDVEYILFAKNQRVSTEGHLHIKVFEVS